MKSGKAEAKAPHRSGRTGLPGLSDRSSSTPAVQRGLQEGHSRPKCVFSLLFISLENKIKYFAMGVRGSAGIHGAKLSGPRRSTPPQFRCVVLLLFCYYLLFHIIRRRRYRRKMKKEKKFSSTGETNSFLTWNKRGFFFFVSIWLVNLSSVVVLDDNNNKEKHNWMTSQKPLWGHC